MGRLAVALLAAPSDGLPCLDLKGLRLYEPQLLQQWGTDLDYTYMQLRAWLAQTQKHYEALVSVAVPKYGDGLSRTAYQWLCPAYTLGWPWEAFHMHLLSLQRPKL